MLGLRMPHDCRARGSCREFCPDIFAAAPSQCRPLVGCGVETALPTPLVNIDRHASAGRDRPDLVTLYYAHGKAAIGMPFNFGSAMDRRYLTFEQAEGLAPLPMQLKRDEVSKELRAKLWAYIYGVLYPQYEREMLAGRGRWLSILMDVHVLRDHYRIDKFNVNGIVDRIGNLIEKGRYDQLYGWLDFVIKHDKCPQDFIDKVAAILVECKSGYRIVDGAFWPLSSEEETAAVGQAISDVSNAQFSGARSHLRNAASNLTQGKYPESIRESISAVESVARVLESSGEFSKALAILEAKTKLHPALKKGFSALYGYTSDEQGIRHALLDTEQAQVEETDALFFIGACASFVSYLINKSKAAGVT
jgi:hypothetical protein